MEQLRDIFMTSLDSMIKGRRASLVDLVQIDLFSDQESDCWHKAIDASDVKSGTAAIINTIEVNALILQLLKLIKVPCAGYGIYEDRLNCL